MSQTDITGSKIYNGLADLGKFKAYLCIIIGSIISIILFIIGVVYIYTDDSQNYIYIDDALIKKVIECKSYDNNYGDKKITMYKCTLLISYKQNNKDIETQLFVESIKLYIENEPIKIMINKQNNNVKLNDTLSMKTTGCLFIVGSIICFISCFLYYYLTNKFQVFSAFSGLGTGLNLLKFI